MQPLETQRFRAAQVVRIPDSPPRRRTRSRYGNHVQVVERSPEPLPSMPNSRVREVAPLRRRTLSGKPTALKPTSPRREHPPESHHHYEHRGPGDQTRVIGASARRRCRLVGLSGQLTGCASGKTHSPCKISGRGRYSRTQ
jgi:hypothetical protein